MLLEIRTGELQTLMEAPGKTSSMVRIGKSNEEIEAVLSVAEHLVKSNGVVVIDDSPANAETIGAAFARWGSTIHQFSVFESPDSAPQNILLFSPSKLDLSRKKVAAWGASYLETEEQRFLGKMKRQPKLSAATMRDIKNTIDNLNSMSPLQPWKVTKLGDEGFDISTKTRKAKTRLPYVAVLPSKELRAEHRLMERIAKPEGLSVEDKAGMLPLRFAEYLVEALVPKKGMVTDLSNGAGELGHAIMNLNGRGGDFSCVVHVSERDCLSVDRLESLSIGSWKNWTYHEPIEPGFSIVG